jgi:hypothetical protein
LVYYSSRKPPHEGREIHVEPWTPYGEEQEFSMKRQCCFEIFGVKEDRIQVVDYELLFHKHSVSMFTSYYFDLPLPAGLAPENADSTVEIEKLCAMYFNTLHKAKDFVRARF